MHGTSVVDLRIQREESIVAKPAHAPFCSTQSLPDDTLDHREIFSLDTLTYRNVGERPLVFLNSGFVAKLPMADMRAMSIDFVGGLR